jgi:hypothetical protein
MAFDWNNFLNLAEELSRRPDEASKRTSVSRAYYSAFHDALDRVEKNCGPKQGGNSHDWCWNKYYGSVDATGACDQVAIEGGRLKAKRVQADYKADPIARLDEFAARALSDARKLKAKIQALNPKFPSP